MLTKKELTYKRIFDLSITIVVLPFAIIPLILLLIIATVSTGRNGLFYQHRVGYKGRLFKLYKIRSLRGTEHRDVLEMKDDETRFGSWLRRTKLDELPQIINVLIGDMSWVGPRPDVTGYADLLSGEDAVILKVKPGITGPATLKYRNEDEVLLKQPDPLTYNDTVIWPDKVKINKEYIENWSLRKDIKYLWASVFN